MSAFASYCREAKGELAFKQHTYTTCASREDIPGARANRARQERIYPGCEPIGERPTCADVSESETRLVRSPGGRGCGGSRRR
eukprot:1066606-Pyramimonas_sp.AAC.1